MQLINRSSPINILDNKHLKQIKCELEKSTGRSRARLQNEEFLNDLKNVSHYPGVGESKTPEGSIRQVQLEWLCDDDNGLQFSINFLGSGLPQVMFGGMCSSCRGAYWMLGRCDREFQSLLVLSFLNGRELPSVSDLATVTCVV